MEYDAARTFVAAAESGSFADAAARVHASPSTVTARISRLEARLGGRLFDRGKQGCRLTGDGERFLPHAHALIRAWEAGRGEVGRPGQLAGSLSVGGQYSMWPGLLLDWLPGYRAAHPEIALQITIDVPEQLNRRLADGSLDIALLYDPVRRADIRVELLFEDRIAMVTADRSRPWRDNYVRVRGGARITAEVLAQLEEEEPAPGLVLDMSALAIPWLVREGAAAFVPLGMARRALDRGELFLVEDAPEFAYPCFMAWRRDSGKETLDTMRASLKEAARTFQ